MAQSEEKKHLVSRRSFLKGAAAAAGLTLVSGGGALLSACSSQPTAAPEPTPWPFPYKKLDPAKVADRAYKAYKQMGCGYGVLEGIIGELAEQVGEPFKSFPTELSACFAAGMGQGSYCGSLGGATVAIGLLCDAATQKQILAELITWYKSFEFPKYQPAGLNLPTTVSNSELCKDSVGVWMAATGIAMGDDKRKERCAGVTADTAMKTVELLNAKLVK